MASYVTDPDFGEVAVLYATTAWHGQRTPCNDVVRIEWEPCRFGGRRPWFRCPRCGRRCASVYLRASGTACRICHRLAYRSQRLDASGRAHRRGKKLMERLGVTGQDAWDLALEPRHAPKPKRMRWETYRQIVAKAKEAEDARLAALLPGLERFFARAKRLLRA